MNSRDQVRRLRAGAKELERLVQRNARDNGTSVERVRLRIAALAICGALSNAAHSGAIPLYLVKGGLALELRFGYKARASKDVDVGIQAPAEQLPAIFERALTHGFDSFSFSAKAPATRTRSGAYRLEVQVRYNDRSWSTVQIDLSEAGYEAKIDTLTHLSLDDFGLHAPPVNVLSINDQIAEKIHACTAVTNGERRGERARDLIDILLCVDFLQIDYESLTAVCERVFQDRLSNTPGHTWPPLFEPPNEWRPALERLAEENGFEIPSSQHLVNQFLLLIARLCGKHIEMKHGFEYQMEEVFIGDQGPPRVSQLNDLAKEGWRVIESFTYAGNSKRLFFLLERELTNDFSADGPRNGEISLPFLNAKLEMNTPGNGAEWLVGPVHNGGRSVAIAIRGVITGVDETLTIGTLTPNDAATQLNVRIDNSQLRLQGQMIQFPALILQFQTENGKIYEQRGPLERFGPDASGRYSYALNGMRLPQEIPAFTYRMDATEAI